MSANRGISFEHHKPVPPPEPPVRALTFAPGFMPGHRTNGPGVRIEKGHQDAAPTSWSVTFRDLDSSFPKVRWCDITRDDVVALRDALTRLLDDNP